MYDGSQVWVRPLACRLASSLPLRGHDGTPSAINVLMIVWFPVPASAMSTTRFTTAARSGISAYVLFLGRPSALIQSGALLVMTVPSLRAFFRRDSQELPRSCDLRSLSPCARCIYISASDSSNMFASTLAAEKRFGGSVSVATYKPAFSKFMKIVSAWRGVARERRSKLSTMRVEPTGTLPPSTAFKNRPNAPF